MISNALRKNFIADNSHYHLQKN